MTTRIINNYNMFEFIVVGDSNAVFISEILLNRVNGKSITLLAEKGCNLYDTSKQIDKINLNDNNSYCIVLCSGTNESSLVASWQIYQELVNKLINKCEMISKNESGIKIKLFIIQPIFKKDESQQQNGKSPEVIISNNTDADNGRRSLRSNRDNKLYLNIPSNVTYVRHNSNYEDNLHLTNESFFEICSYILSKCN